VERGLGGFLPLLFASRRQGVFSAQAFNFQAQFQLLALVAFTFFEMLQTVAQVIYSTGERFNLLLQIAELAGVGLRIFGQPENLAQEIKKLFPHESALAFP
jgi:hypothetical protein